MQGNNFRNVNYSFAYHIADIAQGVVSDAVPYLRNLEGCFGEDRILYFVSGYSKHTALHKFINYLIHELAAEWVSESIEKQKTKLWYEYALEEYKIEFSSFREWFKSYANGREEYDEDDIFFNGYLEEIATPLEKLTDELTEDIFHLMFTNRQFLQCLNDLISGYVQLYEPFSHEEHEGCHKLYKKAGVLKRKVAPDWCKKAVYFRDRGRCCSCCKDLSGLTAISNKVHYDHIVPLSHGGINDVTNLQLLCDQCNLQKGAKKMSTSSKYERWFS
jgi:hypothetical protein